MPSACLDLLDAGLERDDDALVLLDLVVDVALQRAHDGGEAVVQLGGVGDAAADDERGAGLVDEDRVDLVDDRVVVAALHLVVERRRHVVAEVVEAELVVRAVGDVGRRSLRASAAGCSRKPGMTRPTSRPSQWWIRPIHSAWKRAR